VSNMKPDPRQALAPTWLIVTHLLGAAVMLYFVSHPGSLIPSEPKINSPVINGPILDNPVINVAELQAPAVARASSLKIQNSHKKQDIVQ